MDQEQTFNPAYWFPPQMASDNERAQQQSFSSLAAEASEELVMSALHHLSLNETTNSNHDPPGQSGTTAFGFPPQSMLFGDQDDVRGAPEGGYASSSAPNNWEALVNNFQTVDKQKTELLDIYKEKCVRFERELRQRKTRADIMNQKYNYIQEVASTSRQTVADLQTAVQDLTVKNQALQSENAQLKLTLFRSTHSFHRESPQLTGGILVPNATEPPSTRSNWNCYQSGGQQQMMQGYQHHSTGTLSQADSDLKNGSNVSN